MARPPLLVVSVVAARGLVELPGGVSGASRAARSGRRDAADAGQREEPAACSLRKVTGNRSMVRTVAVGRLVGVPARRSGRGARSRPMISSLTTALPNSAPRHAWGPQPKLRCWLG